MAHELGALHIIVFTLICVSELYTSSIVVLLPAYAGPAPLAHECHDAAEFIECSQEFFAEEENINITGAYKNRLRNVFIVSHLRWSLGLTACRFMLQLPRSV